MKVRQSGTRVSFFCPGCKREHDILIGEGEWTFNGNFAKPTFSPSVLLATGHHFSTWKQGQPCWCTFNAEHSDDPAPFECVRCHSFVTDGRIQFLSDSTHALAGQTIDLPDIGGHE